MSTPWREWWAELPCYILLLAVAVSVPTPAALHGAEDKAEEEYLEGS